MRFTLFGSICNVDKIYLFGKYALESSILCQCVPQFNTGSLASRLPQKMLGQHLNSWQGTHKGILESKNTFLPSTHKGWGLSLSLQFSSQCPWDFQFHGKIPSSISMSDKIDPLLRLFSDRISLLWAYLLLCKVHLLMSHLT